MEHAPLRPVPARPAGRVDPRRGRSRGHGRAAGAGAARARAPWRSWRWPTGRGQRSRDAGPRRGASSARCWPAARKELRQTHHARCSGSGWCERAEGLISDRLDGALGERDGRRLDVHLRNCPRCVEHERRLVQATDALLAGIAPARPRPAPPTGEAPLTAVPFGGEPPELGSEDAPPADLDDEALMRSPPSAELVPAAECATRRRRARSRRPRRSS